MSRTEPDIIISLIGAVWCISLGLLVTIGTLKKWNIFLHPIDRIWKFKIWPDAWMKGRGFNERFFFVFNLSRGIVAILAGLVFLTMTFSGGL